MKIILISLIALLQFPGVNAQTQSVKIGQKAIVGKVAPGIPMIQVGFVRNDVVNTHVVRKTKYICFTWKNQRWADKTVGYYIEVAYPGTSNPISNDDFNWGGYLKDIGLVDFYVEKVSYFDVAIRVHAYDRQGNIVRTSQIRLIKQ